ncbi:hypothetical protein Fot_51705 [Forsythia ovata]|uniref:Secreted protein n=1 Tax=Forsythia ovata TaxID=205694 RepID=A0ABD1PW60_9LAMI
MQGGAFHRSVVAASIFRLLVCFSLSFAFLFCYKVVRTATEWKGLGQSEQRGCVTRLRGLCNGGGRDWDRASKGAVLQGCVDCAMGVGGTGSERGESAYYRLARGGFVVGTCSVGDRG